MAIDKKEYQSVLSTLASHRTVAAIINKLAKVWAETEDATLRKGVGTLIAHLKQAALAMPKQKQSAVGSIQTNQEPYKVVVTYCLQCINSQKPQWQIIAEQHGWAPKK